MIEFNKYLLPSLKTNKLIISIDDSEYIKIITNIDRLKNIYLSELKKLYSQNRNIHMMHEHAKLVQMILKYIMELFPIMEEFGACAFLTGSFARCSCKLNSDLDFHIIYFKEYNDESLKYEEIIYYMLSEILALGRNKIHPMLMTKMHPEISTYLENNLDDSDFDISIRSNNYEISYKVKANLKRRLYLQYCRNNTITNVNNYLKGEIAGENREWSHVICPITMKEQLNSQYEKLYKYEKSIITSDKILSRIINIKNKIAEIDRRLNERKVLDISQFKDIYQKKEFDLINEYISLKRDICLFNNIDWLMINYYDNLAFLKNDLVFNKALEYMFFLFKMTEQLGNRYSLHINEFVAIPNFDKLTTKIMELNKIIQESVHREEMMLSGKNSYNYAHRTI